VAISCDRPQLYSPYPYRKRFSGVARMLKATLGSLRRKDVEKSSTPRQPTWLHRRIVPSLQAISSRACTDPILTLIVVALVATVTYMGLLEGPLFEAPAITDTLAGPVDFTSLLSGSKCLHIGADTAWKWQNGDHAAEMPRDKVRFRLSYVVSCIKDRI